VGPFWQYCCVAWQASCKGGQQGDESADVSEKACLCIACFSQQNSSKPDPKDADPRIHAHHSTHTTHPCSGVAVVAARPLAPVAVLAVVLAADGRLGRDRGRQRRHGTAGDGQRRHGGHGRSRKLGRLGGGWHGRGGDLGGQLLGELVVGWEHEGGRRLRHVGLKPGRDGGVLGAVLGGARLVVDHELLGRAAGVAGLHLALARGELGAAGDVGAGVEGDGGAVRGGEGPHRLGLDGFGAGHQHDCVVVVALAERARGVAGELLVGLVCWWLVYIVGVFEGGMESVWSLPIAVRPPNDTNHPQLLLTIAALMPKLPPEFLQASPPCDFLATAGAHESLHLAKQPSSCRSVEGVWSMRWLVVVGWHGAAISAAAGAAAAAERLVKV